MRGEEERREGERRRGQEEIWGCLGEDERMRIGECKRLGGEERTIQESKEEIEKRVKERWEGKDGRIREVNEELIYEEKKKRGRGEQRRKSKEGEGK